MARDKEVVTSPAREETQSPPPPPPPVVASAPERLAEVNTVLEEEADAASKAEEILKDQATPATPMTQLRRIRGRIYDHNGEPLIGAAVLEKGTSNGTISDLEGKFEIDLNENDNDLQISFTGYNSLNITPGNSDSISVILDGEMALLDEVVVTGYSKENARKSKKRSNRKAKQDSALEAAPPSVDRSKARPEGGFRKFNRYVRSNMQTPSEAVANEVSGKVVLQFSIGAEGTPFNILVLQSLGYGCDEEAIRLLKEGPPWENKTDYPVVITSLSIRCN